MKNRDGLGLQIVADGVVLPEYEKDGKTYIAAPWNKDNQLRVLVPTICGCHPFKRFMASLSVDAPRRDA